MKAIKVIVNGAAGRVGREVVNAVCRDPETELVGAVDLKPGDGTLALPDDSGSVPFSADLVDIIGRCQPAVMVDFTTAEVVMKAAPIAASHRVNLVIGTTGLTAGNLRQIEQLVSDNKIGAIVAPNFALGAVIMQHLAKIAARYMDYAEIIELHHHQKIDAPSGTALATAQAMAQARGKPFASPPENAPPAASRGQQVDGVTIHSVRLPGLMAHQEVLLGAPGQTLSIRHDTINRECYTPGVLLAIKKVVKQPGLIYGLDSILDL